MGVPAKPTGPNVPGLLAHKDELLDPTRHRPDVLSSAEVSTEAGEERVSIVACMRAQDEFAGCSQAEIMLYKWIGLMVGTLIATLYYVNPVLCVVLPYWLLRSRFGLVPVVLSITFVILGYWPIHFTTDKPDSIIYKSLALYLDSEFLFEELPSTYASHKKPIIWLALPHGTIGFSGPAYGCLYRARKIRTAAADIVLRMPFIRQVFAPFNLTSGTKRNLVKHIREGNSDVWIYPGGLAELFLSSPDKESIYFQNRKGCIKLAMESGADVVVTYFFGSSMWYRLLCSEQTAYISRQLKISITFFFGRFWTCIPHYSKLLGVTSRIIPISDYSTNPEDITPGTLTAEHARVMREIKRLYESYKTLHPQYAKKSLNVV
eukprot:Blabericola_migrator_1__1077@NODE_1274_length_4917_cov_213_694021_g859_i0_p3_GENE_NODE_1274_length_4917_cov_213_694021_g859_i0NODE_1274_length_4917_cov_213_694021_g859_i0_p3_ORF_typecomplete_len376_score34_78DAGAT/PF03982_13/2_8e32Acyltransferase/PF01553_21/0_018DUF3487/PF11990_8/0_054DUF3487/PF11990_8/2_4e03DUF3487/PF11990_8/3_7e03_NODE_1274_length_4917_cov_213_694021_g859_i018102937